MMKVPHSPASADCGTAKPMRAGRPTAARAAEIDRIILATARQLFTANGIDATSMDAVVHAAKISKGTLYARYASKDVLLLAVIEALVEDLDRAATAKNHLLPTELGPRLRAYSRRLVEQLAQPAYLQLSSLISSAARLHPEVAQHSTDEALAGYVKTLATEMQKAARHANPERVNWAGLANLLIFGTAGWYQSTVSRGVYSDEAFEAYSATVVDAIVALIEKS